MSEGENILVISDQMSVREQLKEILSSYQSVQYLKPDETKKEIDRIAPDVVLLFRPEEDTSIDLVQYINSEYPDVSIIFMNDREDFELLRDVMRAGAIEFFVIPSELSLLSDRMKQISQVIQESKTEQVAATNQSFKKGRGQVYSFFSGKGGSGNTFLASSFAQTLMLESTAQVILIDLNLQFGGIETYLGVESNRSFVELEPVIKELNESHIRNVTEREKFSNLELLLSPRDAEAAENITEDFVTRLIRACRRSYDFVIIDLPTSMNEITYTALEESDEIYYVMNADTPSLQVFKHVELLFQRLNIDTNQRLKLVVNHVGRDNELKTNDLKDFIKTPTETQIRRDFKGVQSLINQGSPLRKERQEKKLLPIAKDIRKWVFSKI